MLFAIAMLLSGAGRLAFALEADFRAEFREVASGVFVAVAPNEEASPANQGFASNLGFIVGRNGVIAIGTGPSAAFGEAMLATMRRITGKPVVLAVNLFATPEHVLGNPEFVRRRIPVLAHRETDRFMAANCSTCIRNLRSAVGDASIGRGALARPSRVIPGSKRITVAGRRIELLHFGTTFQPGSIALLDVRSGVLFAGEIVSLERIPDVRNADIRNWQAALDKIADLPVQRLVPAHGPVAEPQRAREVAAYLAALEGVVERTYDAGVPLQEAAAAAQLPDFRAWALYVPLHARNVHFTYLQVETAVFGR